MNFAAAFCRPFSTSRTRLASNTVTERAIPFICDATNQFWFNTLCINCGDIVWIWLGLSVCPSAIPATIKETKMRMRYEAVHRIAEIREDEKTKKKKTFQPKYKIILLFPVSVSVSVLWMRDISIKTNIPIRLSIRSHVNTISVCLLSFCFSFCFE